jgi:hypothetical protein
MNAINRILRPCVRRPLIAAAITLAIAVMTAAAQG